MFEPNYVPKVVDYVLAYEDWKYKFDKEAEERFKRLLAGLGLDIELRIVDERTIAPEMLPSDTKRLYDVLATLSKDTVLILHGRMGQNVSLAKDFLYTDARFLVSYDSKAPDWMIERVEEELGYSVDEPVTPTRQICVFDCHWRSMEDRWQYAVFRAEGFMKKYFEDMAALRTEKGGKDV